MKKRTLRRLCGLAVIGALAGVALADGAMAQTASDVRCRKCVDTSDIAKKAVNNARIKKNTVAFNRLNRALQKRIRDLEQQVAQLQALVLGNAALDLGEFVSVVDVTQNVNGVPTDLPTVRFEAVNLQVVNGTGQTTPDKTVGPDGPNGLGNVIIGYDEALTSGPESCSDGEFGNEIDCETNGAVWAAVHKSGTHSLVVSQFHNYSQSGNVVFGIGNTASRQTAIVTGGNSNTASGNNSSVSGGFDNTASGPNSSISGGSSNTASGFLASVSGGRDNTASGVHASVSGGKLNTASDDWASVSGGRGNTASDEGASVSGGFNNTASGARASVSGGNANTASGVVSSVSGGANDSVSGVADWRAGGLFQDN